MVWIGIQSQDLQDFILTRLDSMNEGKTMSNSKGGSKANPKLGVKLLRGLI
jgi:hypothetical protein